uniref:Uncharacterized protein n=1 Tax=Utricularia reniformis TaxID=192314 RepID=A0A1Y0B0R1_9LAMI|nr:hypothetical protein AEK19_MT0746 [Utricularia reniformis]ART30990.1 hypothetical protein AEK19_MT0746 [Utricularia reniformis]
MHHLLGLSYFLGSSAMSWVSGYGLSWVTKNTPKQTIGKTGLLWPPPSRTVQHNK